MPGIGAGQMPENLAFGAALSSLSFFCTAVMSALVKATEELHVDRGRPAVPEFDLPSGHHSGHTPSRLGFASNRQDRFAYPAGCDRNRCLVCAVCRNHADAADERDPADVSARHCGCP